MDEIKTTLVTVLNKNSNRKNLLNHFELVQTGSVQFGSGSVRFDIFKFQFQTEPVFNFWFSSSSTLELNRTNRPAGYSSKDFIYSDYKNLIHSDGICYSCTKGHFIQEFKTWSSGNSYIDNIIQKSQINDIYNKLQWIPNDNFQNINHKVDGLEIRFNCKATLKEIKDSRYEIAEFLKMKKIGNKFIAKYYGFSKNPSIHKTIFFVMDLYDDDLHEFLNKNYLDLGSKFQIKTLFSIVCDLDLCKLENDLIFNSDHKNNETYGSISYILPEVLRGTEFTREGNIYSFSGVRPKVLDFMLNWIPEWYLNLMYRCWSDELIYCVTYPINLSIYIHMISSSQIEKLNRVITEIAALYQQKIRDIVNQTPDNKDPVWKLSDLEEL
ncbi:hypothetical protein Glove_84g149 [Diversispora epigaea]|uniref:Protein kinase domain-containing protein n=1 Tax=Diversispora epigaea TaxID=1348612 RepID=A0A397J803_9GLOM|nr:hypothetical protein Glove_84g149 [Diversispora epigaea]